MARGDGLGERILVAEDDLALLEILLVGLRRAEFDAHGVSSGADLLRRAKDVEPHASSSTSVYPTQTDATSATPCGPRGERRRSCF